MTDLEKKLRELVDSSDYTDGFGRWNDTGLMKLVEAAAELGAKSQALREGIVGRAILQEREACAQIGSYRASDWADEASKMPLLSSVHKEARDYQVEALAYRDDILARNNK